MMADYVQLPYAGYGRYGGPMGSTTALFVVGGLAVAAFGAYHRRWPLASFGMALAIFGQGASA
jgi:hypothetical protein